jgi:hypothetical protein
MTPAAAAATVARLLPALERGGREFDVQALANTLTALAGRLEEGEARSKALAAATPKILGKLHTAGPPTDTILVTALLALAGRRNEDRAREAATAATKVLSDLLQTRPSYPNSLERQRYACSLAALLGHVGKAQAHELAARAAWRLVEDFPGTGRDPKDGASALVALLGYLEEAEARKVAAAARLIDVALKTKDADRDRLALEGIQVLAARLDPDAAAGHAATTLDTLARSPDATCLADALTALATRLEPGQAAALAQKVLDTSTAVPNSNPNPRFHLGSALAALAGRLTPEEAAAVTQKVLGAMAREPNWVARQYLARPLPALARRLGKDAAAAATPQFLAAMLAGADSGTWRYLAEALTVLAPLLDKDEAGPALAKVIDVLLRSPFPDDKEALARAVAALAGRLDPGQGRPQAARAAAKLSDTLLRIDPRVARPASQAAGLVALADQMEEGAGRNTLVTAANHLLKEMANSPDHNFRADLARGLAPLAERMAEPEATAVAPRLVSALARAENASEYMGLGLALTALASRLGKDEAELAAASCLDTLVRIEWPPDQESVLVAFRALTERLDRQGFVNLLKHPTCVREARGIILRACERQTKQQFADVWQLIDWLAVNDAGVDVLSPPRAPAPPS